MEIVRRTLHVALFAVLTLGVFSTPLHAQTRPALDVDVRLVREGFNMQGQRFPAWRVEITYANPSPDSIALDDTIILMTTDASNNAAGVHFTRKKTADVEPRVRDRYGLGWGIDVAPTGSSFWPFGTLSSRISAASAFTLMLASTPIEARPGGGFGSPLRPGEKRTIAETLLFPYEMEIRGDRNAVVVLPPGGRSTRTSERTAALLVTFPLRGVASEGARVASPRAESLTTSAPELIAIAGDTAVPEWRRLIAMNWLAETYPDRSGEFLRQQTSTSLSSMTRIAAILNLGLWRVPDSLRPLLQLLRSEPAGGTQVASIAALGDFGDESASPALRPFLSSADETTARYAIQAVGALKDSESVPALTGLLNEGRREYLYDPASSALVRIDSDPARRAVAGMIRDRKTTRLRARSALINAVASGRAMWAQPAVADVVTNEEDDNDLRVTAVNALRTLGDEDSIATLKNVTGSRERKVRDAATSAVQQLARSTPASLPPPDPAEPTPPPAPTTTEPVVAAPAPPPPEKPAPPAPAAVARPLPPPEIPANTKPDPAAARAALENAVQLESVRDWEGALREYRRARVLDPAMIGFIDASIARVQTQMGPDPAGKADGPEALRRARQYDALGRTAEAMLWYERAIQTLPESSADWKAAKDRLDALKAGR